MRIFEGRGLRAGLHFTLCLKPQSPRIFLFFVGIWVLGVMRFHCSLPLFSQPSKGHLEGLSSYEGERGVGGQTPSPRANFLIPPSPLKILKRCDFFLNKSLKNGQRLGKMALFFRQRLGKMTLFFSRTPLRP